MKLRPLRPRTWRLRSGIRDQIGNGSPQERRQMELNGEIPGEGARAEAEEKHEGSRAKEDVSEPQVRQELKESLPAKDKKISGNKASKAGADDTGPEHAKLGRKPGRFRKVLLPGSAALCLFLAAGFLLIKFKAHIGPVAGSLQRAQPVTSIMRPIPIPDYREMLDFLIVYEIEGQKMLTAIRMEIEYQSPVRYQNLKEQNVAFRDTVYFFLLKQNLPGNSVKSWHSVLEKDLVDFLMVRLPQSYPDKILLTQVENL